MGYFEDRIIRLLGAKINDVKVRVKNSFSDFSTDIDIDYIAGTEAGDIEITPFTLDRTLHIIEATTEKGYGNKDKIWKYTRYSPENTERLGRKSNMTPGATPPVFIPLNVLEAFEKDIEVPTLILTEGYIKAFKASLHGLYCFGLPSITTYKEKETGVLYSDILRFIDICKVRNVILLYDHDCLNLGRKDLEFGGDLTRRPRQFVSSALHIKDLIRAEYDVNVYWCRGLKKENGLDDILVEYPAAAEELSKVSVINGFYFEKLNITRDDKKLQKRFGLSSVSEFYSAHKAEIMGEFVYKGLKFKVDGEEVRRVYDNLGYFRVGDDYFQIVLKPDRNGVLKESIEFRKRQTIMDDYGKDFLPTIPKYVSFISSPCNNGDYKDVISNCYNIYSRIQYQEEKGSISQTESFLKHIFGEHYELGLDYLRIMWQYPKHLLPILCLVSKERSTGKTTFIDWLSELFGNNAITVGNDDFIDGFNSLYANKTLIMCDESKIDKQGVLEKLKSLSTSKYININYKFSQKHTVAFFGKFIMLSNYEDNFINTDDMEIRFWVRKVPVVGSFDPEYERKLRDEIPAFIWFLNNTEIKYKKKSRQWFAQEDIETDAFRVLVENSKSTLYKDLKHLFVDFFMNNQDKDLVYCTPTDIKTKWFYNNSQVNINYISTVLKKEFKFATSEKTMRYYPFDVITDHQSNGKPYIVKRSSFIEEEILAPDTPTSTAATVEVVQGEMGFGEEAPF